MSTGRYRSFMPKGNSSRLTLREWLLAYLGPLAQWLKQRWVLPIATFTVAIAVGSAALWPKEDGGAAPGWLVVTTWTLGTVTALLVLLDKLADELDRKTAEQIEADLKIRTDKILRAAEESARNSVSDLNSLIETAHEVAFLDGAARTNQMSNVRKALVQAAVNAIGPGSRATYYSLTGNGNARRLEQPLHAVGYGRDDRPYRPFLEEEDPQLSLWSALERSDTECRVIRDDEEVEGLDWSRKSYTAFVNIPVKARGLVFGMLSVNSAHRQAIAAPQRAVLIGMARLLALVEVMVLGSRTAASRDAEMSAPSDTLKGIEQIEWQGTSQEGSDGTR